MASEYTLNRRYPLYTDNDKPNLRDQYNGAIREIDTDMAQALSDSSAVAAALGSGFDAQHTVRMALDDKATSAALANEVTARESADSALGTRITNETTAREGADTALGTLITNETSARESADTALGTRITSETSARESADSSLSSSIATINGIIPSSAFSSSNTVKKYIDDANSKIFTLLRKPIMVWCGDSFSVGDSHLIPNAVANGNGLTLIDKSANGAGFFFPSIGTNTFLTQLNSSESDVSALGYTNSDVKVVVAYGGVNDYRNNASAAEELNAIEIWTTRAKQLYPNAKIYIIGPTTGKWDTWDSVQSVRNSYADWARWKIQSFGNAWTSKSLGAIIVEDAACWVMGFGTNTFNTDLLHPNYLGKTVIAGQINAVLGGGYNGFKRAEKQAITVNNSNSTVHIARDSFDVHIDLHFDGNAPGTLAQSTSVGLPHNGSIIPRVGGSDPNVAFAGGFFGGSGSTDCPQIYFATGGATITFYPGTLIGPYVFCNYSAI